MITAHGTATGPLARVLRRNLLLFCLLGLFGAGAGFAAGFVVSPRYTSTAAILVTPLDGNPYSPLGRGDELINLVTEAQLVGTDAVARIARGRLGRGEPGVLRAAVTADPAPNTQVLNVSYTSSDARRARAGAQAFAEGYLEYRRQRTQGVLDARLRRLNEQHERIERTLREATQERGDRAVPRQRITAYSNQLSVLDEQINDLNSTPVNPGQVISSANTPSGPGAARTVWYAGGGLVAGLLVALGIALLRERSDHRVRDVAALERLGVPVLGEIPPLPGGQEGLVLVSAPQGPAGQAYRKLRAALVANRPGTPATLLVSCATPGELATMTSSNLAVALAHAGASAILVDACVIGAEPAALFGLGPGKGLSDVLMHGKDPAELLVHADPELRLLPRGERSYDAAERLSGPRMREAVATLRSRTEVLIINAPGLADANAQALCTYADAVLLVVTLGTSTREQIAQAYAEAERAGASVIGTVAVTEGAPPVTAGPGIDYHAAFAGSA